MIHNIIYKFYPEVVSINGLFDAYDKDGNKIKIDEEKVKKEIEKLKNEIEYQFLRKKEYPSIENQLDILYHEGFDSWKKKIKEIKDKYPKSE